MGKFRGQGKGQYLSLGNYKMTEGLKQISFSMKPHHQKIHLININKRGDEFKVVMTWDRTCLLFTRRGTWSYKPFQEWSLHPKNWKGYKKKKGRCVVLSLCDRGSHFKISPLFKKDSPIRDFPQAPSHNATSFCFQGLFLRGIVFSNSPQCAGGGFSSHPKVLPVGLLWVEGEGRKTL